MSDIALAFISFVLTFGVILILIRLAPRFGLLDHPNYRKNHNGAIPTVGGIALYLMMMVLFLSGIAAGRNTIPMLVASSLITLIGGLDDRSHVTPRVRLLTHFIVAAIMVYGAGLHLDNLGTIGFGGEQVALGPFGSAVTIFGIMSVINAMNFIDGLDGLAGGLSLIAVAALWGIFIISGHAIPDLIPVMTGGLVAFLFFNSPWLGRKRATVFLGDAGSTLLGMLLAWLMVDHSQGNDKIISPVTALWLLAIPLIDFLAIVIRRAAMGRHPFQPDREHVHHILVRSIHNDAHTVGFIYVVALICAAIGILGQVYLWQQSILFYTFLSLFIVVFFMLKHSSRFAKMINARG